MPPVTVYAFLLFVLLYFPCIATIAAIRSEIDSWNWALFTALYITATTWGVSVLFYQIVKRKARQNNILARLHIHVRLKGLFFYKFL